VKHYPKSSNKSTTSKSKTTESVLTAITTTDTATTTSSLSDREIEERLQVYRPELREIMRNEIIQRMEDRRLQIENERKRK
jgi:predicted XRE-type DNA-binding protein